jgi:hypothetical protein
VGFFGNVRWNKSGQALTILGHKVEMNKVTEPTDVDWMSLTTSHKKIVLGRTLLQILMTLVILALIYFSSWIGSKSV